MDHKPARGTFAHTEWMIDHINQVAETLGVPVESMSRDKFLKESAEATRSDIEACDNWGAIRRLARASATEASPREELAQRRSVLHANTHRRALERQIGDVEYISQKLQDALADAVATTPPRISKLPKRQLAHMSPARREIVALVSDTHFGQITDPDEVVGQRYDWKIAARRMARYVHQVSTYKHSHRKGTPLRLVLNGDIIEGKIHTDDNGVDLMAAQIDGARQILTDSIDYLRHFFDHIVIECTTGNHGRWPFKGPGRATAQKYDSAATTIYRGLEAIFRDCPDVEFHIPRTPYNTFMLCGTHRAFVTHGDTVFQVGSPGKSVNVEKITRQVFTIDTSKLFKEPIAVTMLGHYHFPLWCKIENGSDLLINGCASGTNAYAQSLGIFAGRPTQIVFESTDEYAVGDCRMVDLAPADNESILDEIVHTPTPIGNTPVYENPATTDFYALANEVKNLNKGNNW